MSYEPDWYDTHCPTCDAPEPSHTPTCAVVNLGVGCDVHGNDCMADCVHRGEPRCATCRRAAPAHAEWCDDPKSHDFKTGDTNGNP